MTMRLRDAFKAAHAAFAIGAAFALGAALLGYKILRIPATTSAQSDGGVHELATAAD